MSTKISAQQLAERVAAGEQVELIDVRTPVEFREAHVKFAQNVPLDRLDPQSILDQRNGSADQPLYLICQKGGRGEMACEKFRSAGFENVINVDGGTNACQETSLPITRGKKAISLERQVRIAAGSLVLIGVAAGLWVHPACFGISAFVGAGLIFAGITDTCGMGMMLSKMPWNQCSTSSPS